MIYYYFRWLLHGNNGHYSYRITSHCYNTKYYIFKLSITYTKTDGKFQTKFCAQTHLSMLTILLSFTFLKSFTSHIKKTQKYRHWSITAMHLEPETLNFSYLKSITMSELLREYCFHQTVGFSNSTTCSSLSLSFVLVATRLYFKRISGFWSQRQEVTLSITGRLIYGSCCNPSYCPSDRRAPRRQHGLVLTSQAGESLPRGHQPC